MTPSWIWPRAKQVRRIYYDGLQAIKSNARDYDIQLRQGRSGKDSLTGLLQVHSSVGWLPVSFQNPAYRELHICRVRSLLEKPEHQQLYLSLIHI